MMILNFPEQSVFALNSGWQQIVYPLLLEGFRVGPPPPPPIEKIYKILKSVNAVLLLSIVALCYGVGYMIIAPDMAAGFWVLQAVTCNMIMLVLN